MTKVEILNLNKTKQLGQGLTASTCLDIPDFWSCLNALSLSKQLNMEFCWNLPAEYQLRARKKSYSYPAKKVSCKVVL